MATVNVVSIFTRLARSSDTAELRLQRATEDVRRCNEVWNTGFPGGWSCTLQFNLHSVFFRDDVTINADTVSNVNDQRIIDVIAAAQAATNNAIAIYVVYLNGNALAGGQSNANGGPYFTFFNNVNNYGLIGRVVMTDSTVDSYVLAHESGHVLFGRFLTADSNSFTIVDPSNPGGTGHNQDPRNVMFGSTPSASPLINQAQCNVAHQSRVVLPSVQSSEQPNAIAAVESRIGALLFPTYKPCGCCSPYPPTVKELNCEVTAEIRRYGPCEIQITPIPKHDPCECEQPRCGRCRKRKCRCGGRG